MNVAKLSSSDTHSALDAFCSVFLFLLAIVAIVFHKRVPDWETTAFQLLVAIPLFLTARKLIALIPATVFSALLKTASILGIFVFMFDKIDNLQLAIVPQWMDDVLINWEISLFGMESTQALDAFVNPLLTEWMMYAYVIYSPMMWGMGLICYYTGGQRAVDDYVVNLAIINTVCCVGFLIFPLASPLFHMPDAYRNALSGGFFSWCGEWIRNNLHFPGGSLPSMHCANATVMLAMLYRYKRQLYYLALPTILTLYVSTVYGRYHYMWDGVTGILSALLVLKFSPAIIAAADAVRVFFGRLLEPRGVGASVQEEGESL